MLTRFEFDKEKDRKEPDGILYLFGSIETGTAHGIVQKVIELNRNPSVPFIQLIINSNGGYTTDGFAIIDILRWSRIPVYTTGIGLVASMGLLILMAGAKGHRVVTPRTSILSHRFRATTQGPHSNLVAFRKEEDLMHRRILDHYIRFSNLKTVEEVETHLLRESDVWLSPEEAVHFGLADEIDDCSPVET